VNCPALVGAKQVKLPNAAGFCDDESPVIETKVPEDPPVHVTGCPADRVTVAAAL
jgi:hypothetical protein